MGFCWLLSHKRWSSPGLADQPRNIADNCGANGPGGQSGVGVDRRAGIRLEPDTHPDPGAGLLAEVRTVNSFRVAAQTDSPSRESRSGGKRECGWSNGPT
ncbi:hypothetical protein Afe04nite_38840 [Asanoa ferruginea]|nr:hypothetical protein Afe04nite_38840 [Asanoa ferruginea]